MRLAALALLAVGVLFFAASWAEWYSIAFASQSPWLAVMGAIFFVGGSIVWAIQRGPSGT